jgi:hypothetical protein
VRLWDLRRIRGRLESMGLDWHLPPYAPAPVERPGRLRVEIDPGHAAP